MNVESEEHDLTYDDILSPRNEGTRPLRVSAAEKLKRLKSKCRNKCKSAHIVPEDSIYPALSSSTLNIGDKGKSLIIDKGMVACLFLTSIVFETDGKSNTRPFQLKDHEGKDFLF
jgi:hypothetical protein